MIASLSLLVASLLGTSGVPSQAAAPTSVVINEVQCHLSDSIELYNPTKLPIDMSNWILTDKKFISMKHQYIFARGFRLAAGAYLVLRQGKNPENLTFGFSCSKPETIRLGYLSGQNYITVDEILPPVLLGDFDYGRVPNGVGPFDLNYPSIGASNITVKPIFVSAKTASCVKLKVCRLTLRQANTSTFTLAAKVTGVTLTSAGKLTVTARKAQKLLVKIKLTNAFGVLATTLTVTIK